VKYKDDPKNFAEAIDPLLDLIDRGLGFDEIPVSQRAFPAARKLVEEFIPEIRQGDEPPKSPGSVLEFCKEPWFKNLHTEVQKWYVNRYGDRATTSRIDSFTGVVLVASTPFEVRVPITASQVEVEGETAWLSFPADVYPNDDVKSWVMGPPNWEACPDDIVEKFEVDVRSVASLLRKISCRLTGVSTNDSTVKNILAGVKIHLRSAARLIANEGQEGSFARAQWELQMACESAYKSYIQQKNGKFRETHDLFRLNELAKLPNEAEMHSRIKAMPRWWDAASLRYGLGDHPTIIGIFAWYQSTLGIIASVVENMEGVDLTKARLLIQKAPWVEMADDSSS
jgi:hypothetical protein